MDDEEPKFGKYYGHTEDEQFILRVIKRNITCCLDNDINDFKGYKLLLISPCYPGRGYHIIYNDNRRKIYIDHEKRIVKICDKYAKVE